MIKKIIPILIFSITIFISGCTNKFYLDQEYYDQSGNFVSITSNKLNTFDSKNYVLFVYNNYCAFSIPCDEIFKEYMVKNGINFLYMPYEEFKSTKLHETVSFAPSIIIVKNGKIIDYLDTEKDEYLEMYQDVEKFGKRFEKYVNLVDNDKNLDTENYSKEESENQYYMNKEYSDVDTPEHRIITCEETAGFFLNFNEGTFTWEDESDAGASYARNGHVNYIKRGETAEEDVFCFIDMVDNRVMTK